MEGAIPASVQSVFDRALAEDPRREALVTRSGRLTYAELDALANRAAQALRAMGVSQGDRVAACLPNDLDVVAAFHGTMRLGAIWVGINRVLAPPEQAYILRDSGASVFLTESGLGSGGRRWARPRRDRWVWTSTPSRRQASPTPAVPPVGPRGRCTASTGC